MTIKADKTATSDGKKREAGSEADADTKAAGAEGEADAEASDDAGEEDEPDDAEDEKKAAAGEQPAETPAQRRARLAKDSDVASLVKQAAAKAVREALAKSEADAKKAAELASKTESERLAIEKADEATKREAAEGERDAALLELGFYKTMSTTGLALVNPRDMAFVQQAAAEAMREHDLDVEAALAQVAEERPHWFKKAGEADATAAQAKVKAEEKKATTSTKGAAKGTERQAAAKDEDPKARVRGMTPAEFAAEAQRKYGVALRH